MLAHQWVYLHPLERTAAMLAHQWVYLHPIERHLSHPPVAWPHQTANIVSCSMQEALLSTRGMRLERY